MTNLPTYIDPQSLDPLELRIASGLICAARETAAEAIAGLRGTDFSSAVLETVVRAVDRTLRADRPRTPGVIATIAVEHGLVRPEHEVALERLLHDLLEWGTGAPGAFDAPGLAYRGALRAVERCETRCRQARAALTITPSPDETGRAIAAAGDLADVLDGLADDLSSIGNRLRQRVAPPAREEVIV